MKKVVIILIIVALLLGFFIYKAKSASNQLLKTETVKRGNIVKSVSASGKVTSEEKVELKFQTSGLLSWVGVKEGDYVNAWQTIAQLDTRELQKTLDKYLRDYSKERNDFEEERRITYGKLQIEEALTDTVKRILEKNQWDLEKAVLDVELKDLALKFSLLTTPISGIVTQIDTPVAGVNITPASAVFEVANPEKMIFRADVDEADISGLTASQSAKISLDAYPDNKFDALVQKVGFSSVSTSGGGNAYPVEFKLPKNDHLKFKLGMNGDVDISTESKDNVLVISSDGVFKKDHKTYVWLVENKKALKREIKTGLTTDNQVEILAGLSENDKIIISPISKINEGQQVN